MERLLEQIGVIGNEALYPLQAAVGTAALLDSHDSPPVQVGLDRSEAHSGPIGIEYAGRY
jgi:hypothetical protein